MTANLKLSTFQISSPRKRSEGLRIGATRRPSQGVPKALWKSEDYFNVWFPTIAPSAKLIARLQHRDFDNPSVRRAFFDNYERELLSTASGRQAIELIAEIAKTTPVSIGCFCADESCCHRSRLYEIIRK